MSRLLPLRFLVLVPGIALVLITGIVSAHGGFSGTGMPVEVVVLTSAVIGTASGLGAAYWPSRRVTDVLTHRRFALVLGAGLTVLGISFLVPVVGDRPLFAVVGTAVGFTAAWWITHQPDESVAVGPDPLVGGVLLTIAVHRAFEGVVLAAGLRMGATLSTLSVLIVTVHAAGETAIIGGLLALSGRVREAIVAVLVIQVGFVVAATIATAASVAVPSLARYVTVTVAAGLLAYFGLHECISCHPDYRRSTP